ncbi:MAG: hypothetical protein AB7H90_12865 [Alphaproteobacteria bacterium]
MGVFVLTDSQTLVPMQPASFVTENDFQELLSRFPALLSGAQDGGPTRRWLLLKREMSIPSEEGGNGRWSLDHLFVDQDGVPTLVEVKRQSDTRLRREVVGQMLDYAANAVVYWPIDELRDEFITECAKSGKEPGEEIRDRLDREGGEEALFQAIKRNLQSGRIRMLFVADRIPPELRRIVEFLNKQMDPAEVLALELQQFQGQNLRTIVPVVYGQTEEAIERKSSGRPRRQWDRESFLSECTARNGFEAARVAKKIADWMQRTGDGIWFGQGIKDGSIAMMVMAGQQKFYPFSIWTYGRIEIGFQYMMKGPLRDEEKRRELLRRLNEIEGINLSADAITRRPTMPLTSLSDERRLGQFFEVMRWLVAELRAGAAGP